MTSNLVHDFSRCPRCHHPTRKAQSWTGESEFWYECTNQNCNTYINTYMPQSHQTAVHTDAHRIKGNFGGYGSGKTTTDRMELEKHILITPNGTGVVGANVMSQYEQTIKREFLADFPKAFIQRVNTQKDYIDFINGYRLMFRPFDDAGKLRSLNVDLWIMIEASEIKEETFTQLKTRLRNMAASTKDGLYDWRQGLIESNPSAGWIKTEVVNCSDQICKYGTVQEYYTVLEEDRNPDIATHITSTDANRYLPSDFIETQKRNKPKWWVSRYLYGSFLYADGLVYPSAVQYIEKSFEIPKHWKRICAFDYGLADASCFLFGAIDEERNLLHIYKEVFVNNRNVEELAKLFFEATQDIPVGGWLCAPLIDPKSAPKRDYNKKSLADSFLDYGITFLPGQVNREARVFRTNTYLESGRVRIMNCCYNLIEELKDLKFKQEKNNTLKPWQNIPEDHNDHAVVCLEWIIMELPLDPNKLMWGVYGKDGARIPVLTEEQRRIEDEKAYQRTIFSENNDNEEVNYFYGM